MPRTIYNPARGLIQKSGTGMEISGATATEGSGYHVFVREMDLGVGFTPSATDNGLICTVATLPDNALILRAYLLVTETFSNDSTRVVDLSLTSTAASADAAITASNTLIDGADLRATSGDGTAGDVTAAVFSGNTAMSVGVGTEQKLVLMNKGTSNNTTALTAGKVLVFVEYLGTAAAKNLDDVEVPTS